MRSLLLAHMEAGHMFDLPEPPMSESVALVVLPDLCPACGSTLRVITTWQPALFIGCGFGATLASNIKRCNACSWWIATGEGTVNPREFR